MSQTQRLGHEPSYLRSSQTDLDSNSVLVPLGLVWVRLGPLPSQGWAYSIMMVTIIFFRNGLNPKLLNFQFYDHKILFFIFITSLMYPIFLKILKFTRNKIKIQISVRYNLMVNLLKRRPITRKIKILKIFII